MKLMLTYIKKSAAISATQLFKSLPFDPSKGIKHLYTQLLCTAESMIMRLDQATFNEHFINAPLSQLRGELVLCDQVSVDYMT